MGKDYDFYITPQNTPRYRERRILFLLAMGLLITNMILIATLHPAARGSSFVCAALASGFAVVQCLDKRKDMWSWGYIIIWCILDVLISAVFILWLGTYWYLFFLTAEIVIFCICAFLILKRTEPKK